MLILIGCAWLVLVFDSQGVIAESSSKGSKSIITNINLILLILILYLCQIINNHKNTGPLGKVDSHTGRQYRIFFFTKR